MKKTFFLALICLCAPSVRPAVAAYVTGYNLAKACQSDDTQQIYGCVNYIAGVIDYNVMMQSLGTEPTLDFCLPEDLPLAKAAFVVAQYLQKSPQHNDFIAAPAVMMALHENYPCGPVAATNKKKKK